MSKDRNIAKYFEKGPNLKEAKKRSKQDVNVIKVENEIFERLKGIGKYQTYHILTYGCQMNAHDTEVMAGILEELSYTNTEDINEADVIILNTCAIRENAENKVFGKVGSLKHLKQANPDVILAVCGCMSQEEEVVNKLLKTYPYVDLIFGTHNIHRLPNLLDEAVKSKEKVVEVWSKEGDVIENLPRTRKSETKAWVNIIYGCDKFCTYCIVPFTRGKERSRRSADILLEIQELQKKGYQEVTLLGQNVNAYGNDLADELSFGKLLEEVAKIGIPRVRFTTSHPWEFTEEMIEAIAKYPNIMSHVHLPVQAGNNAVLKIMGRSYTREGYLELFDKIKNTIPNVAITTDIIVGYPNETEEQFAETLTLYDYCKFDQAYTYIYSARAGTPAAKMVDNVTSQEKKDRLRRLNEAVAKYSFEKMEKQVGKTLKILVEGPSNRDPNVLAGYSESMKLVHFTGDASLIGKIVEVKIYDAKNFNLYGDLVEEQGN
ncbi:MAG: tRNA (N6-isopentenyl adenosine(37)-C2)-methylthiotransferase MiaB [Mycoplasmatales bacterium]